MKKLLISLSLIVSFTLLTVKKTAQADCGYYSHTFVDGDERSIPLDPCPNCDAKKVGNMFLRVENGIGGVEYVFIGGNK